jgi:hypothetical protein
VADNIQSEFDGVFIVREIIEVDFSANVINPGKVTQAKLGRGFFGFGVKLFEGTSNPKIKLTEYQRCVGEKFRRKQVIPTERSGGISPI